MYISNARNDFSNKKVSLRSKAELALAVREMRRVGLTVLALVYWWDDRFEMCENPIGIGQAE